MDKDYYKILGITGSASGDEIKKAYHRLAKQYHPDSNGGNKDAGEVFKEVNEAYHVLSDADKKYLYDSRNRSGFHFHKVTFEPYFIATIDTHGARLNEEFEITFRYLGEGRVFNKPESSSLFYNSSPVVHHRVLLIDGGEVKETSMTFTVSALETGTLTIPPASIYIQHKLFQTEPLSILISGNNCFFKKGEEAGWQPYFFYMHREEQGKTVYRRTYIYRHALLIPRSNYAYYYHNIGAALKMTFTILGFLYSIAGGYSMIAGLLLGSLLGGLACHSMYLFTGVRSKFYYALQYSGVKDYLEDGYKAGREVGYWIFAEKGFYILLSLFR